MRERAADIRDVSKRVLAHLLGVELPNPSMIDESVIIVGNDLTPSDTAQLNKEFVQGFVTNIGGREPFSNYESIIRNCCSCWYKISY